MFSFLENHLTNVNKNILIYGFDEAPLAGYTHTQYMDSMYGSAIDKVFGGALIVDSSFRLHRNKTFVQHVSNVLDSDGCCIWVRPEPYVYEKDHRVCKHLNKFFLRVTRLVGISYPYSVHLAKCPVYMELV